MCAICLLEQISLFVKSESLEITLYYFDRRSRVGMYTN